MPILINPHEKVKDFYPTPLLTIIFLQTVDQIVIRAKYIEDFAEGFLPRGSSHTHRFFLEDAGQQKAIIEPMKRAGLYVTEVPTGGLDKRSRLALAAQPAEQGRLFCPHKGTELLEEQILNFGSTRYDDVADAFSTLMCEIRKQVNNRPGIIVL